MRSKSSTLYDHWEQCQLWLPHVLNLKETFRRERLDDPNFYACTKSCMLWTSFQRYVMCPTYMEPFHTDTSNTTSRYLVELNSWSELEDLVSVSKTAIGTLATQDPELWMRSATETHVGQMHSRQGHYYAALSSLLRACDIKNSAQQVDLVTLCWTQDNIGINYNCMLELESALEWHTRAHATWKRHSEKEGIDVRYPPLILSNYGRTLSYMGRFEGARKALKEALGVLLTELLLNWGLAAA